MIQKRDTTAMALAATVVSQAISSNRSSNAEVTARGTAAGLSARSKFITQGMSQPQNSSRQS